MMRTRSSPRCSVSVIRRRAPSARPLATATGTIGLMSSATVDGLAPVRRAHVVDERCGSTGRRRSCRGADTSRWLWSRCGHRSRPSIDGASRRRTGVSTVAAMRRPSDGCGASTAPAVGASARRRSCSSRRRCASGSPSRGISCIGSSSDDCASRTGSCSPSCLQLGVRLPRLAHRLGQLLRAEDDQRQQQDHDDLAAGQVEHARSCSSASRCRRGHQSTCGRATTASVAARPPRSPSPTGARGRTPGEHARRVRTGACASGRPGSRATSG